MRNSTVGSLSCAGCLLLGPAGSALDGSSGNGRSAPLLPADTGPVPAASFASFVPPASFAPPAAAAPADPAISDWFRNPRLSRMNGDGGGPAQPDGGGLPGADELAAGRHAAQIIAEPVRGDQTAAGLPVRVPRANLLPGSAGGAHRAGGSRPAGGHGAQAPAASRPPQSPELARSRLSGFQRGARRAKEQTPRAGEGTDR